jgi:hypothetical protein
MCGLIKNIKTGTTTIIEYELIPLTEQQLKEQRRSDILSELATLDEKMTRTEEDIITYTGIYNNLPQIQKDRYDRKQTLRAELQNL